MEINKHVKENTSIAYISMEIGLDSNIPTYSGGLGVLSGDTVRSAADLEIPMVAICLCYSSGYFYQLFNENGEQKEKEINWSFFYEFDKVEKPIKMKIQDKPIKVSAWLFNVIGQSGHVIPVYLLTTDVEGNEEWQRKLTAALYDSTSRWHRIVQETILGIGGVRLLESLGYINIKKYHINEGHGAFSTLELLKNKGSIEEVKKMVAFTTHTPVPAGHDRFNYELVQDVFRDYAPANIKDLGGKDELNMTVLAMNLAGYVNGVSKKHGEVTREMFPNYNIDAITNGVHLPFWVSKPIRRIFDKKWPNWKSNPTVLKNAIEIDDLELFDAHIENKFNLISYQKGHSWNLLDEELITIGFARRFATYKRAILIFNEVDRLGRICKGNCQFIFAGKAHPKDQAGKDYIKRIFEAGEYLYDNYGVKVVLMENYNMDLAHMLVSGVDVWLNTPERYREASGTSGMKAALNGILNFSVQDGWWLEGYKMNPLAGWAIGPDDSDPEVAKNDWGTDANWFYEILENKIIPTYMDHDEWLFRMKNAISLAAYFNTHRMVEEYAKRAYSLKKQRPWKYIE
ncbi:MAG: alpha-glucan family phosphorylase [Candidatus Lokiarchaeota archaeon]|nr:alpha-glucan family phosphorylase [Candidatus Lokiarchaeota archaeon]MBD3339954.1 alpha-glucan family phosphorylase [Candidatus Lokiarchaeota archaeon]